MLRKIYILSKFIYNKNESSGVWSFLCFSCIFYNKGGLENKELYREAQGLDARAARDNDGGGGRGAVGGGGGPPADIRAYG